MLNSPAFIDWKQAYNIIEMVSPNLVFPLLFCYAFFGEGYTILIYSCQWSPDAKNDLTPTCFNQMHHTGGNRSLARTTSPVYGPVMTIYSMCVEEGKGHLFL